jgi:hypothetical protein
VISCVGGVVDCDGFFCCRSTSGDGKFVAAASRSQLGRVFTLRVTSLFLLFFFFSCFDFCVRPIKLLFKHQDSGALVTTDGNFATDFESWNPAQVQP